MKNEKAQQSINMNRKKNDCESLALVECGLHEVRDPDFLYISNVNIYEDIWMLFCLCFCNTCDMFVHIYNQNTRGKSTYVVVGGFARGIYVPDTIHSLYFSRIFPVSSSIQEAYSNPFRTTICTCFFFRIFRFFFICRTVSLLVSFSAPFFEKFTRYRAHNVGRI